ncbi:MAG: lysophospholipid acyltransferase family protein [Planctomycetota bacterium]
MKPTSTTPISFGPERAPRSPFWDRCAWVAVSLVMTFFNVLPASVARWLGRRLGNLIWWLDSKHRRQVLWHMNLAFRNEKTSAEKKRLCYRYFEHMGLAVIEFARMKRITKENVDELVDFSALKLFDEQLARGKGLLCVPAHHGNWELCGYAVSLKGYPLKSVARPLDNPLLNEMINKHRERSGNVIIEKWKVLWKLKKLLDQGGIVTMSIDQNGGVTGLFVPFFNVLASTLTSPAELHLATGAPIIVATLTRQSDGIHHVLRVWDIIAHSRANDHATDVKTVTMRINAAVEKAIREHPEQWLWVHKRWKTRPPGEIVGPDGIPAPLTM